MRSTPQKGQGLLIRVRVLGVHTAGIVKKLYVGVISYVSRFGFGGVVREERLQMNPIAFEDAVELALDAVLNQRLALLIGAGLSMAPPSNLPSAWTLADKAKRKYDAQYGTTRPPLSENIDEQAEFFFQRGELTTVYLASLIDRNAFAGPTNAGHRAIADMLLS